MANDRSAALDYKGSRVLREWNMQRAIARGQQSALRSGGFAGAAVSRLTASLQQWSGSINADLDGQLVILRARARGLCANSEYGKRFLSLVAGNVIGGEGRPKLQVRATNSDGSLDKAANDAIEVHWDRWAKKADITGRMTLSHLLRVALKGVARDGEALLRKIRDRKLPYGMAVQLLEPDRLDEGMNVKLSNGNMVRQGVELDTYGRPVAYHLRGAHPGEAYVAGVGKAERVPATDLLHIFLPERAEQVRGYTWLHAVLNRSNLLQGFEEAAVVAARVGAAKMGVFKQSLDAVPDGLQTLAVGTEADGSLNFSAEAGEFVKLPPGYELQSWDPEYPHANFDSFLKACQRGIASGLDVAAHNLTGDMTSVNYSSARIAEMTERDMWTVLQDWAFNSVLVPLYEEWLNVSLLTGSITFDSGKRLPVERYAKFRDVSRFQGRRWAWIDPAKDVKAKLDAIEGGLTSRTRVVAEAGDDIEDILVERQQEERIATDLGVTLGAAKAAPTPTEPTSTDDTNTQE